MHDDKSIHTTAMQYQGIAALKETGLWDIIE